MQVQPTQQGDIASRTTSEDVIPSVQGEFYSYRATFTSERPLGYLMKCKANKDRPLRFAEDHVDDLDLVFLFREDGVRLCSPDAPASDELLNELDLDHNELNYTQLAPAGIITEEFEVLRRQKDGSAIAEMCRRTRPGDELGLSLGSIIAVTTQSGKYGLLRVRELAPSSVTLDACHILL